jgi:hypothetical protein
MNIQLKEIPDKLIRVYAMTGDFPFIREDGILTTALVNCIIIIYGMRETCVLASAGHGWNDDYKNLILMPLDNCDDYLISIVQQAVDDGAHAMVGNTFLEPEEFEKLVMNTNYNCIKPRVRPEE